MPGGLAKALKTLEEHFGQPFQVVRACVESLTEGPAIQANDKDSLLCYADTAQVTYDTLESMGYLSEMNIDNLEKVIARLPKWMQSKFAEHLKNLERKGQKMPNFKDVVDFLKERAFVLSHPFFTKSGTPKGFTYSLTATNPESCAMCHQHHPLYHYEVLKSKSPRERNDFVKQKKICFNCINSTKHNSKKCKSLIRCRVEGCGKSHHTLLHFTEPRDRGNQQRDGPNAEDVNQGLRPNQATISMCSTVAAVSSCEVLLQVIPVRVLSKSGNQITTFGLLDSGSDITMIDLSLVKLLNIKGSPSKLSLTIVNNADAEEKGLRVDFKIAPVDSGNDHLIDVKSAWAVKDLTIPLKHTKVSRSVGQWSHLQQAPFPEVERSKISILLGTNIQEVFIPLEVKRGKPNELIAIKSCIGWSILGGCPSVPFSTPVQVNLINGEDVTLSDQLEEFWRVESYGTSKCETKPLSVEDQRAMNLISNSICKHDGHYEMGLLWKSDNPVLPYNRTLAEARLQHLKRRFLRDPELEVKYRAVIEDCVTKGYARKLTKEEAATVSKTTWFLPHHPVSNPNKPGKVRVMFDAAARFSGTSLNEQLLQGPSLTNDLSGVLIRFCEEEIAFSTDIEGMFYQTRVTPSDTDSLRFLWWPKGIDVPPEEYKMLVHIFGAKSSPCCANKALSMTAQDKENYPPEVIRTVRRNFYVDDVLKSIPNTDQAIPLASDLMKLLREGGFRLTKFASNSCELLASIPPASRANPKLDLDLDQLPLERALGVYWDAQSDTFKFKALQAYKPSTK